MPPSSPKKHLSRLRRLRAAMMLVGLALAVLLGHGLAYGRLGAPAQHAVTERTSSAVDGDASATSSSAAVSSASVAFVPPSSRGNAAPSRPTARRSATFSTG